MMKKAVSIIISLIMMLASFSGWSVCAFAADVSDNLVIHYTFDEVDENGLLCNEAALGKYNATLDGVKIENGIGVFNGETSTIIMPEDYAQALKGSYSVSMWVNIDSSIASSTALYRFFDFGNDVLSSHFLRYVPAIGELMFMDRGTAYSASDAAISATNKIETGKWTHIALTYDMTTLPTYARLFVDGKEIANSGGYSRLARSLYDAVGDYSSSSYIGRTQWNNTDNPDFKGKMDDIRIYGKALDDSEIESLVANYSDENFEKITVSFVDKQGNKIKDDIQYYGVENEVFSVSEKDTENFILGNNSYTYLPWRSTETLTIGQMNECTLVFDKTSLQVGSNLISNPSFETDVNGWTSNSYGSLATVTGWVRSAEQAHDGRYSLKRNQVASGNSSLNLGTYFPIESGKVYKLSFWEYSTADVAAGNSMMSAACVAKEKVGLTGKGDNHLVGKYGGFSSWYNDGKVANRDSSYVAGWQKREYLFDTTGQTDANYILIAYAWSTNGEFYIDDFSLCEFTGEIGTEKGEIEFKYTLDGNVIYSEKKEGYVGCDIFVDGEIEIDGSYYLITPTYAQVEETVTACEVLLEKKILCEEIELPKDHIVMNVGEVVRLDAKILPENAHDKNISYSTNSNCVQVAKTGEMYAYSVGKAVVTITSGDKMCSREVVVEVSYITDNFTYTSSGTLTVFNETGMNAVANDYYILRSAKRIVIKGGIKTIPARAFYQLYNVQSVVIPESVITIGESAFAQSSDTLVVYYAGDKEAWKDIYLDYGNSRVATAIVHYNSTMINDITAEMVDDEGINVEVAVSDIKGVMAAVLMDGNTVESVQTQEVTEEVVFYFDDTAKNKTVLFYWWETIESLVPVCEVTPFKLKNAYYYGIKGEKPVDVYYSQEPEASNCGTNLFDGDMNTNWASHGEAYAIADMGSEKNIKAIGLAFKLYSDDRVIPYDIYVSNDKVEWEQVCSGTSEPLSADWIITDVGKRARYVKLVFHGNTVTGWSSVGEAAIMVE